MHYFIITGTSRGIGAALAERLLGAGNHLFCISRGENQKLKEIAASRGAKLTELSFDLGQTHEIKVLVEKIFAEIELDSAEGVFLVNNAGTVEPVGPLPKNDPDAIQDGFNINLLAPVLLTRFFVEMVQAWPGIKRVINITSGAAQRPVFGWSTYCSSKAGIDMFTRCVTTEQEEEEFPVQICALAPGVVATQMQAQIRGSGKEEFRDFQKFIDYKKENKLLPPEEVARVISWLLLSEEFPAGSITRIDEFI